MILLMVLGQTLKLLTAIKLLAFRGTWVYPRFWVCSCCSDLSFLCSILASIVCLFVHFLFAMVLSVLLRIADSDYPYVIFSVTSASSGNTLCTCYASIF